MEVKITKNPSNLALLRELNSAIKKLSIYPADHPAVKIVLKETCQLFQEFFKSKAEIILGKVENKLVLEGETLDANSISDKVWNTLERQKIKSISFSRGLGEEELKSFLEFFLKKEEEDLSFYFEKNKISHIKLNRLHYEIISDDEKVIKADLVDKLKLKSELSKAIRAHPELLKDILLGKLIEKEKWQAIFLKEGFLPPAETGGESPGRGISGTGGGEMDIKQVLEEIKDQIDNLSDDEILAFLTYNLKQSFKEAPKDKNSSDEALEMIKRVLDKRDKQRLLPKLKELLSAYGIIDEKYFDLLINETWKKKEETISSDLDFLEKLEKDQIDKKNLEEKVREIIFSSDEKLKKKIIHTLLEKMDSKEEGLRQDSITVLKKMIELSISEEKEVDFVYIKGKLLEVPEKNLVSLRFYRGYFELLPLVFSDLVKRGNLEEIKIFLEKIHLGVQGKERLPELVRSKKDFMAEISTEQNLNLVIQPAVDDFNAQKGKTIEEVLRNLDKRKVAQKLLEIFTTDQRSVRLWALRILSGLGEDSAEAITLFLKDKDNLKRGKGQNLLAERSWYKVRNALFVLGNIESQKSIDLLWDFKNDPDSRVRLEVVKGLEKKKGARANQILKELLKDKEEEIRKKALNLISLSDDKEFVPGLKEVFFTGLLDRKKVLAAVFKLGEEACREFALKMVTDETFFPGNFSRREKGELQLEALSLIEKNADDRIFQTLESCLRKRKKGFLGILHRDEVTEKIAKILSLKDKKIGIPRL